MPNTKNHQSFTLAFLKKLNKKEIAITTGGLALIIISFTFLFSSPKNNIKPTLISDDLVELTLLRNAKDRGAFCLDGSLPAYHYQKGYGSGSDNWILHIEGGGWCDSISSCLFRKTTALGSSDHMERQVRFSGLLSPHQAQNPDFFNWNKVKIRYCDGASLAGHPEGEFHNGTNLFFRGQLIWEALIDELLTLGMSNAREALLSGCSAGGLATMIHCDDFRAKLPDASVVKCLVDASFFLDEWYLMDDPKIDPRPYLWARIDGQNSPFVKIWKTIRPLRVPSRPKDISGRRTMKLFYHDVVKLHGVHKSLPRDCVTKMDPSLCFFPQQIVKSIKTPIFFVHPAYDFWQIQHVLIPASSDVHGDWQRCRLSIHECNARQITILQGFRDSLLSALGESERNKERGMFINSCYIHCQTWMETWHGLNSPKIDNKTIAETVHDWYFNGEGAKRIDCPFPCNPSCLNLDFTRA